MANRTSAESLSIEQLIDELAYLYATRHRTLRFAPDPELADHTRRMSELEREYQQRMPRREVPTPPRDDGVATARAPSETPRALNA